MAAIRGGPGTTAATGTTAIATSSSQAATRTMPAATPQQQQQRPPPTRRALTLVRPGRYCSPRHNNSHLSVVLDLVSKIWYRIPLDESELSVSKPPPTDLPNVGPGRDP